MISCGLDEVYPLDSEFFSTWNENEPRKYQSHLVCWAWGKEGDLSCGKCLFQAFAYMVGTDHSQATSLSLRCVLLLPETGPWSYSEEEFKNGCAKAVEHQEFIWVVRA